MAARRRQASTPASTRRALYGRTSERDFQKWVFDLCHRLRLLIFHDPDARRCPRCGEMQRDRRVRGFPDLVIVRPPTRRRKPPYLLFVELKTEAGRLSEEQQTWSTWLTAVAKMCPGVYYGVWRPGDLDIIIRLLADDPNDVADSLDPPADDAPVVAEIKD